MSTVLTDFFWQVPYERRVNRATVAVFRFKNGFVGSLNHTLLMHGHNFFTELDLYGDGFHIIVRDPYQKPSVLVRRPHSNDYEQVLFIDRNEDAHVVQVSHH